MTFFKLSSLAVIWIALASCGQVNAPLNVIGDPSTIPELERPTSAATFSDFTSTSGFVFNAGGAVILAPADGVVAEQTSSSVTIVHSGRLSTKMVFDAGITSIVRTGDFVQAGQQITQQSFGGTIRFTTILDGKTFCPWGFLSLSARQFFNTTYGNVCSLP